MAFNLRGKKIWVAGHNGMVGRALIRALASEECDILTVDRQQLDLRDQQGVGQWMSEYKPDAIFLAAAKVGGIGANQSAPAEFLYDNLAIASNVIHAAYLAQVQKLLFLGSVCIYPKFADVPVKEEALLTGALEPTNQAYAMAKIAGLKMCEAYREQYGCDFISAMPTNLYGPYDHFNAESSHVIPALIHKLHHAKRENAASVTIWGTGTPRREFLHVDDLASALILLMREYSEAEAINIGCGVDILIKDLAAMLVDVIGYKGELLFDTSKPDGTPRRHLDTTKMDAMGWKYSTDLREGLEATYDWYLTHVAKV